MANQGSNQSGQPWWKAHKNIEEETFSDWQELRTEDGLAYYFNRVTQETTWDKPEELMTDEEKQSSTAWVWVPDTTDVYLPARKMDESNGQVVVELESGEERYVNRKDLIAMNKSSLQRIVADLTLLDEMSVPLILHCLRKRFEAAKIYSAVGTILISINPYTQLDLYTPQMIRKYRNSLEEHREVPPHVFVVADQAYKGLTFESGPNQSIVISGESGAGKTEATKQCLSYLGAVAGSVAGVEKKVFDANPILEGFGNAKTLRNNNSSRFGKYVEIFMNDELQLMGGKTTNYLLEKVRVARQSEGERNYHIFYMLTKGCDRTLRQALELGQSEQYFYCTSGNCTTVPGINDKGDFDDVREAFKTLEFNEKDVDSIYRIIAGILHIGNIEFERVQSNFADDTSKVKNRAPLATAAKLWQVDASELEKGVTHKALVMPGNKSVEKGLNPEFARDQRDSLCKFVYAKIFDWLVVQINKSMEPKKKVHKSIGILDIFGFEIFQKNSLEQLCINFCNEKLQQLFNFTVFKQEEKVYQSEAIGFDHVPFIDNEPILNMIEEKPKGMMPLLDEEGKTPGGSEEKYRAKLTDCHSSNKYFRDHAKDTMSFVLSHYAGDVNYDVRGFIEKNKDELDRGLLMMLDKSKEHMVRVLFPKDVGDMSAGQRKATLSLQFRNQLSALMKTLHATQPHYIRCIKPNEDKEPLYFVPRSCFEQLTYSGVFEAVKIRKAGFPFRLKHGEFADRYKCILEEAGRSCGSGKTGCTDILKFLNMNRDNIREGKTMMLYRAGEHKILELKRSIIMEKRKMNETLEELVSTDPNSLDEPELFFERLARAVRACRRYNINSPLAEKARKLLAQYVESRIDPETKRLLEEAISEKDINKLEAVCEIIEREQYETDKCMLALRMRDRIHAIIRESEKAVTTLETSHMEACLFAAQELGYNNQYIEYFQYMFETLGKDTDKFVQEQLRQAVRTQDLKRQTRLNIKLKDIFFDKMGSQFGMHNCPVLKGADEWAKEKLFGRDKLKEGYLVWSEESIHSQLTTIDKKFKKDAQDIFKNIQIYMMDKPAEVANPDNAGLEILLKGHAEPDLRNEIYCQLIKQLTNNPKNQSVTRGWNAMILCLYSFPPSQELENYLEVFIRNQPQERRDRCLVALQSLMYSKNAGSKRPPTLQDMTDILNGSRPIRRDFLEEPPEVPSWAPLLKSFFDEAGGEEEYFDSGPELAGAVAPQPKSANNKPLSKIKRHNASIAKPPQTPATSPPNIQYGNSEQETIEETEVKTDTSSQQSSGPPPVPIAALNTKKANTTTTSSSTTSSSTTTEKKTTTNSSNSGGGTVAELQAKLAQRGGPMFNNQQQQQTKSNVGGSNVKTTTEVKSTTNPTVTKTNVTSKTAETTKTEMKTETKTDTKTNTKATTTTNTKKTAAPPKKSEAYQWLCHLDPESGEVYYENIASGETQWERPAEPVKPYWLAHNDPESGDMYFENIDTGATAWEKPDEYADAEEKWLAKKSPETGEYFYENLATGKTQWEVPPVFQEKQPQQEWVRHFDPNSGDYYYENLRTGETTWDAPSGIKFE